MYLKMRMKKVLDAIENKVIDINDCIYDNVLKLINGVEDYAWVLKERRQQCTGCLPQGNYKSRFIGPKEMPYICCPK